MSVNTTVALAADKKKGIEAVRKILLYWMISSLFVILCVCFWLYWIIHSSSVASQSTIGPGKVIEGTVFINGTTSIGRIDDDFICATLDWWPPEKRDYGTRSWGRTSLLNLVS
jgi:hypothetical protein